MTIYINADNFGELVTLFPEHIFEWKISGVNCPTEDYTVGNVSAPILTFRTDIDVSLSTVIHTLADGNNWINWKVIDKVKNANAMGEAVSYTITAITQLPYDLDDVVPDSCFESLTETSTLEDVWAAVVGLYNITEGTQQRQLVIPLNAVNKQYVVGNKWYSTGLTYRQVMSWCAQLMGVNVNIYGISAELPGFVPPVYYCRTFAPSTVPMTSYTYTPSTIKKAKVSEYTVPVVDKIWFGVDETDVGLSYGSGTNQMSLSANPMINPDDDSFLQPLYDKIHSLQAYTPMEIETFSYSNQNMAYFCELAYLNKDWFSYVISPNQQYNCPIFSYEMSEKGFTIIGTGNRDRGASNQVVSSQIANAGKYNKLRRTIDETVSEIGNLQGEYSQLSQTVDSIETTVSGLSTKASTISTDTIYYLATSASSGITPSSSGWTTTPQSMTATNQYLWTYHKYTYADGHTSNSSAVITGRYGQNGTNGQDGQDGDDGIGITSITSLYYAKANSTAPAKPTSHVTSTSTAGGAWRVAVPTLSSSYPYMFTCDEILYTNGTYGWTTVVQNTALTDFNSRITQNANSIGLVVTQSSGGAQINAASIVAAINSAGSSVDISADHINLNGAVTANNNVTIGQDGVISAVGASLTNVNINGGTVLIRNGGQTNSAITLQDGTQTYQSVFSPNGFSCGYKPSGYTYYVTTAQMNNYGGINAYFRNQPGITDEGSKQFVAWGGNIKSQSYLKYDGLGVQGGPSGAVNSPLYRASLSIDAGSSGSSATPTYNTSLVFSKEGVVEMGLNRYTMYFYARNSNDYSYGNGGIFFYDENGNVINHIYAQPRYSNALPSVGNFVGEVYYKI